jgi:hypothetical protein
MRIVIKETHNPENIIIPDGNENIMNIDPDLLAKTFQIVFNNPQVYIYDPNPDDLNGDTFGGLINYLRSADELNPGYAARFIAAFCQFRQLLE